MPLAKNVMSGGLSAGQAKAVNGNNVNATVTAAGTTQATATALTADGNIVSTATSGQGVILYAGMPGDNQRVYNSTTADIRVYPPSGAAINQIATNGAMVLAPRTSCNFYCYSATQWVGNLSA